jgi:periplasmic protein TonB
MNEKLLRLIIFIITAALHLIVIFFLVFNTGAVMQEDSENARVMKLTDLAELPPPPPDEPEIPQVEEIAEVMIETDIPPIQNIVPAGTLNVVTFDDYLQVHQVSVAPKFDDSALVASLVYPPIALRSGIEGRVVLELFVDRTGAVQKITILREEPEGKGFGEAAIRVFTDRKGTPAYANDEPVSCRYRYPVVFRIK